MLNPFINLLSKITNKRLFNIDVVLIVRSKSNLKFDQIELIANVNNKMPRLRKHSQIKQNYSEVDDSQTGTSAHSKQAQSNTPLDNPLAKRRMKYSERAALISTYENEAKQCSDADEDNITNSQIGNQNKKASDVDIDNYLSKFKDDDTSNEVNPALAKKKKKGIRISNKMFADCNFQDSEEVQIQQLQLVVERRQAKNVEHLMAKVERRVEGFKNRLQFKNLEQDHKFKQHMKHKLKQLQGCEEVNLVIEVPQVVATNKHIDGALYLKNVKQTSTSATVCEEEVEDQIHKDRKLFYQHLSKRMKMKKAETLTQSALKECFKKSRLDATDYLCDQNSNEKPIQDDDKSKTLTAQGSTVERALVSRKSGDNCEERKKMEKNEAQQQQIKRYACQQVPNEVQPQETIISKEDSKEQQISKQKQQEQKQVQREESNYVKQKTKKKKNKRKGKKFNIHDLIQEEAEDSEDENCPQAFRKNDDEEDEEDEDDDTNLSSLIDDDVTLCEEEEEFAHRKFIKDMIEMQEQKFARMQKKLHQQRIINEEKLRKRMEQASKKNASKDKPQQKIETNDQSNPHPPSDQSDESISNAKNIEKLKQLEIELGISKPPSQSTTSTQNQTGSKHLANFERLMSLETVNLRKPMPSGLRNLEKYKFRKPKAKPPVGPHN